MDGLSPVSRSFTFDNCLKHACFLVVPVSTFSRIEVHLPFLGVVLTTHYIQWNFECNSFKICFAVNTVFIKTKVLVNMASDSSQNNFKWMKSIIDTKAKIEKSSSMINLLTMENFEYAAKCNRMKNILGKVSNSLVNSPTLMLNISNHLCEILQACATAKSEDVPLQDKTMDTSPTNSPEKVVSAHKAHLVKPHMVNGHILYIPTINLTRVHTPQNSLRASQSGNESSCKVNTLANIDDNGESSLVESSSSLRRYRSNTRDENIEVFDNINNSHSEEVEAPVSSPSKSSSHSTVLSGTFQEVKIYLNQTSQDSLDETIVSSPKSARKSKVTKRTRSSQNSHKNSKSRRT